LPCYYLQPEKGCRTRFFLLGFETWLVCPHDKAKCDLTPFQNLHLGQHGHSARTPQPHSLRPRLSYLLFINNNTSPVPGTQHIFNMLMRFTLVYKSHKPRVHSFFSKCIYFASQVSCVHFSFPISFHCLELRD